MSALSFSAGIAVIVNDAAGCGHGNEIAGTIETLFREAGMPVQVTLVSAAELKPAIARAIDNGVHTIVAGGGDGTLSAVASVLADSGIILGVLPLGTLNHFAKDQQIPLDLAGAVRAIVAGHMADVDVGEVNGRVFINNSSIGIYPKIVRLRERHRRRFGLGKWPALIWATWQVLRLGSSLRVKVDTGDEQRDCRTAFAFVGNNEYVLEGFEMGARKSLQQGILSLYTARPTGRLGIFRLMLQALFGRLKHGGDFAMLNAADFLIDTRQRRLSVATDGEIGILDTPLRYRSRPAALRVLVPEPVTTQGV